MPAIIIFFVLTITTKATTPLYPFDTSNLLLLEWFVIAIPSFALALQPNKNIIRGKFLSNVISRCIPGGLTLVMSVMAIFVYFLVTKGELPLATAPYYAEYISLSVLAMTFTGMMVLVKICEPLDAFRSVLLILSGLFTVVGMAFFWDFFEYASLSNVEILITVCVVEISFPLMLLLTRLFEKIEIK